MNGHFYRGFKKLSDGSLTSIVKGGYNIVDVRDVADGIIKATDRGVEGRCYLLSGQYHTIYEIIEIASRISQRRKIRSRPPHLVCKDVRSFGRPLVEDEKAAAHLHRLLS